MNRYAYRLPGSKEIKTGGSDTLLPGLHPGGFYVKPFDGNEGFTIPATPSAGSVTHVPLQYIIPKESTTRERHAAGIKHILEKIGDGMLDKCVLARVDVNRSLPDAEAVFRALCDAYPSAFVFGFRTPETGTWIGASPELLLSKSGRTLTTMALAGTRPAGTCGEWDEKNREEQAIVRNYIAGILENHGCEVKIHPTETAQAGPVEHIRNMITAIMPCRNNTSSAGQKEDGLETAARVADSLSPTPALCGSPREEAFTAINEAEDFRRGCYGGCCGPVSEDGAAFDIYVNLRSMCIKDGVTCLFAGGGIVAGSEPDSEWHETERKLSTIKNLVPF